MASGNSSPSLPAQPRFGLLNYQPHSLPSYQSPGSPARHRLQMVSTPIPQPTPPDPEASGPEVFEFVTLYFQWLAGGTATKDECETLAARLPHMAGFQLYDMPMEELQALYGPVEGRGLYKVIQHGKHGREQNLWVRHGSWASFSVVFGLTSANILANMSEIFGTSKRTVGIVALAGFFAFVVFHYLCATPWLCRQRWFPAQLKRYYWR